MQLKPPSGRPFFDPSLSRWRTATNPPFELRAFQEHDVPGRFFYSIAGKIVDGSICFTSRSSM